MESQVPWLVSTVGIKGLEELDKEYRSVTVDVL